LGKKSLEFFTENLQKLESNLSKVLIFSSVKEMVLRDNKISSYEYFKFIEKNLKNEENVNTIDN